MNSTTIAGAAAAALLVLGAGAVQAQTWPDRPIKAIVPFAAGGANDVMARVVSPYISKQLGQPVIIENRPGANGHIGIEATAKSKPDGYTILYSATASTVLPAVTKNMRYDPIRDIQPVAEVGQGPYAIYINPRVQANNLRELVELMKIQNNLNLEIISYNGNGPTATAVVKGEVDFCIMDVSAFVGHLQSGRVKALAIAGEKRLPSMPDLPTTAEAGFPDLRAGAIFGVYVAAGTPADILQKLNTTINGIIVMPEVVEQLRKLGAEPNPKTVPQFSQLIRKEIETWREVVTKAKLPMEEY